MVFFGAALCAAIVCAQSTTETEAVSPEEIAELIEQLGDDVFVVRETATTRLKEIGIAAETQLVEALKTPDPEVRFRTRRVLTFVLEDAFNARLEAFAADVDGSKNLTLPGWDTFRQHVGGHRQARLFFVTVQRSEPELMQAYEVDAKRAARVFAVRCRSLQQVIQTRFGNLRSGTTLGSLAGLLLVGADPDVPVSAESSSQLYNFLQRSPFQTAMNDDEQKPLLRTLLGAWIARDEGANSAVEYQKVVLAMRYELKEGLAPAIGMARLKSAPAYYRLYGMLAIGKLGGVQHREVLEPLLAEDTLCTKRKVNKEEVRIEIRDVALAVLIYLTGQEHGEYGYKNIQKNDQFLFNAHTLHFADDLAREAGLKKWQAWAADTKR